MTTVLVVDDAPDVRSLISQVLGHAGYRGEEAGSGAEALRRLAQPDPAQLVVLDVQMPVMDGWETLATLRRTPALADLPVILCTVRTGAADAVHAWEVGSDGYMTKPFSTAALVAEVQAVHSRSCVERTVLRGQRLSTARTASSQESTMQANSVEANSKEANSMDIGVLIVDDESDIRLLVRRLIEAAKGGLFVSGEATSGTEAVEHAETDDPLVIVLDNMMPEMSGVEAANIIRSRRPAQEIILFSAYLDQDLIDRARAAGVRHVLAKAQMSILPALIRQIADAAIRPT